MTMLIGERIRLRPATTDDITDLLRIRLTPAVRERWRGDDIEAEMAESIAEEALHVLTIETFAGTIVGAIQWAASDDPDYPHASVDIFVDPDVHGQGLGTDAVRTLCQHLVTTVGFHRLVIDPAADNLAAIRCYERVGFQRVGIMRRYERSADGTLHDGLLMDLLAPDLRLS